MRVTVDTNVLVRAAVRDDPAQFAAAGDLLKRASTVAVTLPSLCELVWVLGRVYGFSRERIFSALQALVSSSNVTVDRPAAEAGLAAFHAGADFADGVIAHEGGWLGGDTFVSFDKKAVSILSAQGFATRRLR